MILKTSFLKIVYLKNMLFCSAMEGGGRKEEYNVLTSQCLIYLGMVRAGLTGSGLAGPGPGQMPRQVASAQLPPPQPRTSEQPVTVQL